jgi:hypothetical protein
MHTSSREERTRECIGNRLILLIAFPARVLQHALDELYHDLNVSTLKAITDISKVALLMVHKSYPSRRGSTGETFTRESKDYKVSES